MKKHPKAEFKKGHIPWNKGLTTDDVRVKKLHENSVISQKKLFKEGKLSPWNKNKKTGFLSKTPELTKKKMSESRKREKHWNWQGGISKDRKYKKKQNREWVEKNRERKYFINARRRARKIDAEGSHSIEEWQEMKKRFNYTCLMCGKKEPFINQRCEMLTEDHIIPLAKGGTDYISNIQPLCLKCNVRKHTQIISFKS